MSAFETRFLEISERQQNATIKVHTLGIFEVSVMGEVIPLKAWGRDKTLQLFQYFITSRSRSVLHKEQIINRLWETSDSADGDRDFKVALHGINKVLEPHRPPRQEPEYIIRQGVTYQLDFSVINVDAQSFQEYVSLAHEAIEEDKNIAVKAYREAITLCKGVYLPSRIYEDWSSEERERLQVLILSAYMGLAELMLAKQPLETIRLTQEAIKIDPTWEDAYLLQMRAYLEKGNRPGAIKTYHQCVKILDREFGLDPLPETQSLYDFIV